MAWGEKADKKVTAQMDAEYGQICKITPESIARMAGSQGDRDEATAAMVDINKETDKAKRIMRFKEKMSSVSAGAQSVLKKAAGIVSALAIIFILAGPVKAESWVSPIWDDVKANSHLNLGTDIAYGAGHDFINGKNYRGGIFSIYNYRKLHLEYGLLDPFKDGPVSHSIGSGIRIQPFINWARIPDKYKAIKYMYINTSTRYDLHHWGVMLLVHAGYGK